MKSKHKQKWNDWKYSIYCGVIAVLLLVGGIWGFNFKPYKNMKKYTGTITNVVSYSNIGGHRGWFSFQCQNKEFYIFHQFGSKYTYEQQYEILQSFEKTQQEVTVTTIPKKNFIANNFLEHGNQLYAGEIRDNNQIYFDLDISLKLEKRFAYICCILSILMFGLTFYFIN